MSHAGIVVGALLLAGALTAVPVDVSAQVFLASRPASGLAVRPLFIVATISSDAADVPVEVLFSLVIPPDRSALDLEQDIHLLWPGEIGAAEPGPGFALPPAVAAQVTVVATGRAGTDTGLHD